MAFLFRNYDHCYIDDADNPIRSPEDIVVSNAKLYKNKPESGQKANGSNSFYVNVKGLKPVTGAKVINGIYSSYEDPKTHEYYNYILSKYTHNVIPFEALDCMTFYILLCGRPGAGKTTTTVQYVKEFTNILNLQNKGCRLTTPLLLDQYPERFRKALLSYLEGIVPDPTNASIVSEEIPLLFKTTINGEKKTVLIKFIDVPGEHRPDGKYKVFTHSEAIWLFLDLSDPKSVYENAERLRELTTDHTISQNVPVYIILTKADKLVYRKRDASGNFVTQNLYKEFPETLKLSDNGLLMLKSEYLAATGYSMKEFNRCNNKLKEFVELNYPAIYASLEESFGSDIKFFILGNYMMDATSSTVPKKKKMFRVEQPLLHFLADNELYPKCKEKSASTGSGFNNNSVKAMNENFLNRLQATLSSLFEGN